MSFFYERITNILYIISLNGFLIFFNYLIYSVIED